MTSQSMRELVEDAIQEATIANAPFSPVTETTSIGSLAKVKDVFVDLVIGVG